MIPHKDIITIVHVAFITPAAMKNVSILPVSLVHFKISFIHISQDVKCPPSLLTCFFTKGGIIFRGHAPKVFTATLCISHQT